MKLALPFLLAVFAPLVATAEEFAAERVVAAASGDWDGNGKTDLALITGPAAGSAEDNGVYIYLADPDEARLKVKVAAADKIWGNLTMSGQEPGITALANGSIKLTSQNSSVGRDRWSQSLTLAYRNARFIVAGYTYSSHDTLDAGNKRECDLNVLTGKGTANGKSIAAKGAQIAFEEWNDEIGQRACGFTPQ